MGLITNEGVSSLDAIRNDNGDSVVPHLDPIVLRGMEQLLDNLKETIELSDDDEDDNDVKLPPQVVYPPMIDLTGPNLQDLLTNDNQNSDTLDDIRAIRDTINTEVGDISSPTPPDDFPGNFDDTEFEDNPPPPPQLPYNPFGSASAPPFPDTDPPPYPTVPPLPDYDDTPPLDTMIYFHQSQYQLYNCLLLLAMKKVAIMKTLLRPLQTQD